MRRTALSTVVLLILLSLCSQVLAAPLVSTRIKDISKVQGVRTNQLVGYGLVVGLAGTGDSNKSMFTIQSVANMLKSFGVVINPAQIQPKNVAAVMVTAKLPAFVKEGDNIDITVSSMGDAKSLAGGTLLQTPLRAANGQVYAVGQGPLSVGGYAVSGGGSSQQKNFPTVGTIPNGAIVERDVEVQLLNGQEIALSLNNPDFTTANRITESIGSVFGSIAQARDAGTVVITIPPYYRNDIVAFIAAVEELPVIPDAAAKVVINERTGTVVMGSNVTIDEVAVAQGGLSIKITKDKEVSQPPPLSGGSTQVVDNTQVQADEQKANVILLPATANVGDVVAALNAAGATPRDIIAILQAMKAAGALRAELEII